MVGVIACEKNQLSLLLKFVDYSDFSFIGFIKDLIFTLSYIVSKKMVFPVLII